MHGLILAASTTLSKRARDKLVSTARLRDVQEAYFWGQAELENLLLLVIPFMRSPVVKYKE